MNQPVEKVKLAERIYSAHQLDFFERHIISQGQRELPFRNAFRNDWRTVSVVIWERMKMPFFEHEIWRKKAPGVS